MLTDAFTLKVVAGQYVDALNSNDVDAIRILFHEDGICEDPYGAPASTVPGMEIDAITLLQLADNGKIITLRCMA